MKKKVVFPISVSEELIEWIKKEAKKEKFRNRSHLVEQAINDFKKNPD